MLKKITAIVGSPRKGNSYTLAKIFLNESKEEYDTELIFLSEKEINNCKGCYHLCTTKKGLKCIFDDDMKDILNRVINSDLVLFVAPLYNSSYPAIMASFLERCLPLWEGHQTEETLICDRCHTKVVKAILAMVQEEKEVNAADLAMQVFEHTVGHIYQFNIVDRINTRGVKMPSDLRRNKKHLNEVKEFTKKCLKKYL